MKKYLLLFGCAIVLTGGTLFAQQQEAPKEYAIVLHLMPKYQDDKAWGDEDMKAVNEHFMALQQLQKENKIVFAGRTLDKASLGLVVFKNMSEEEVREVLNKDAAVKRGIMKAEVKPFTTVLKEQ